MAARDFRLLSDVLANVRSLVDQPTTDPNQMGFTPAQFWQAANDAQEELSQLASQLDVNWFTKEVDVAVARGVTYVELPSDCRTVRTTDDWNTSTNRRNRELAVGEWGQLGVREYDTIFKPKDTEHDNKATLRFLVPSPRAFTMRVAYDYFPKRLVDGVLPVDAGGSAFRLAEYESTETGMNAGTVLYIVADPNGTPGLQAFGSQAIEAWVGSSRLASFAAPWNPVPKRGARYTSRPDLPRDWERLYTLEMGVTLGLKLPSRLKDEWKQRRDEVAASAEHRAATMDRRAVRILRSRSVVGPGFTGDPINSNRFG